MNKSPKRQKVKWFYHSIISQIGRNVKMSAKEYKERRKQEEQREADFEGAEQVVLGEYE